MVGVIPAQSVLLHGEFGHAPLCPITAQNERRDDSHIQTEPEDLATQLKEEAAFKIGPSACDDIADLCCDETASQTRAFG